MSASYGVVNVGGHKLISDRRVIPRRPRPKVSKPSARGWEPFWIALGGAPLGANLTFALADSYFWEVTQLHCSFITNLVGATRIVTVGLTAPGLVRVPSVGAGVPNAATSYLLDFADFGYLPAGVLPQVFSVLPGLIFPPATVLDVTAFGIGAGDQFLSAQIQGKRHYLR